MTGQDAVLDVAIAHLDRADRHIVRPQIEGAAAFEVEAGVVAYVCPTGQPALERGRLRPASKRCTFPPWRLAVAIRRYPARAMEQGEISFFLWQHGHLFGASMSIPPVVTQSCVYT